MATAVDRLSANRTGMPEVDRFDPSSRSVVTGGSATLRGQPANHRVAAATWGHGYAFKSEPAMEGSGRGHATSLILEASIGYGE